MPWREWKNPRLVVRPTGITVLVSGESQGPTVPPSYVGDILENTTVADWPLGLVVMAKFGFGSHGWMDETDDANLRSNSEELKKALSNRGIRLVWGPPPA